MNGKFHEATNYLRLSYLYAPETERASLMLQRAELSLRLKRFHEAAALLKLFIMYYPEHELLQTVEFLLAETYRKIGRYRDALRYYRRLGESTEVLFGIANTLHLMGRYREAYKIYLPLLRKDRDYLSSSEETRLYVGENLKVIGRPEDARLYLLSVKGSPLRYRAYLDLADITLAQDKPKEAIRNLQLCLLSPEWVIRRKALVMMAEANMMLGRVEEAKANLLEVKRNYPPGVDYDRASLLLTRLYRQEGNIAKAEKELRHLILRTTPFKGAMKELKELLLQAGKSGGDDFLVLWRRYRRFLLRPSEEGFLLRMASLLSDETIEYHHLWRWLFENGSATVRERAAIRLADLFLKIGDTNLALRYLKKVESASDGHRRMLSRAYYLKGDYARAFRVFQGIKRFRRQDISHALNLALRYKRAVSFFRRVLREVSPDREYLVPIADLFYINGYRKEALRYYRMAVTGGAEPLQEDERWWVSYRLGSQMDVYPRGTLMVALSRVLKKQQELDEELRRVFYGSGPSK